MRFRLLVLLSAVLLLAARFSHAQDLDSVIHVKVYPGSTVGDKVRAASHACVAGSPCILVIDPSMSAYPEGSIPGACPSSLNAGCTPGINGGDAFYLPFGVVLKDFRLGKTGYVSAQVGGAAAGLSGVTFPDGTIQTTAGGGGSSFNAAAPGPIGGTTPSTGSFTALSANTYAPASQVNYGDSITACYPLTNASLNQCYVYRLANYLGYGWAGVTNRGFSGDQACDVNERQLFPNDVPAIAGTQPLRTLQIGTNDASVGTGAHEATFHACFNATLTYLATPASAKVMGSAMTSTGTCTTDTHYAATGNRGIICTANGSTASASITTAAGAPLYIWARSIDGDAGTWTYALDGGTAVSVSTALASPIATANGNTQSVVLAARITGLAAGSHTVTFAQTHAGTMAIVGIGTSPSGTQQTAPYVLVSNLPNRRDGVLQTATSAYRANIGTDVNLAMADGLNVTLAKVSNYVQATTAAGDYAPDGLHPNGPVGHAELFAGFLSAFRGFPAVSAGLSTVQKRIANGSETITNADQAVTQIGCSATETLPPTPYEGQLVTVQNYCTSGGVSTNIAANTGQLVNNASTLTLKGLGAAVTLQYLNAYTNWVPIWGYTPPPTAGMPTMNWRLATASETATATDQGIILNNLNLTETLPASPPDGQIITVRNFSSGNGTVTPNTGQVINGASASITVSSGWGVGLLYLKAYTNWVQVWSYQPPPARGTATLAAGTVTVSNAAACAAGSQCVYKLANCGVGGTQGMLSVGTVTAGTSFVINSSSAADTSAVCWQVN